MSAIRESLIKLDSVVGKLESCISGLEDAMAGRQRDMFGVPPSLANNSNDDGIDGAIVVQALDQTIARVEKLLKEAA